MSEPALIRRAESADAAGVGRLAGLLGRSGDEAGIRESLRRLEAREDELVLVAVGESGELVGWLHGSESEVLGVGRRCTIHGLVIDEASQRRGLGRALVAACQEWVRARGLHDLIVRSNVVRAGSHPFYEGLGFTRSKTQHAYRKRLG